MNRRPADRLFLSDAEIAARIPMPLAEWLALVPKFERQGLPKPDPLFNNRRCWPRVSDFLCGRDGSRMPPQTASGEVVYLEGEVPHGFRRSADGRRARAQNQAQ